jgi:hypothetical protein
VKTCEACGCPSSASRSACAFCDAALVATSPVAFVISRSVDRVEWLADGTVVAAATQVHGLWRIVDAHSRHVVSLMPLSPNAGEDHPTVALVGPSARMLGTIHRDEDDRGRSDAITRDDDGVTVLVMRGDGPNGSHIIDCNGEVVAVSSWGEHEGQTDLLVTTSGTRQPLALVFGLVLTSELTRHAPHRLV